jgi:hypothetical protein
MATAAEVAAGARGMLRDHPKYFEVTEGPLNVLTIRLPHPLISPTTLQVYVTTPPIAPATDPTVAHTTKWVLDEHNGLLKLTDEAYIGQTITVAGYHFVWFSESDLNLAIGQAASEQFYNRDMTLAKMAPVESEVLMMGAVVRALWSLSIELALDIDVSTPEGMYIPAHQRYSQVIQQMQFWEGQYQERLGSLNIGLGALEQFRLRRVALTTGRYVPVYVDREFDDPRWPHRLYPAISEQPDTEMPTWAKVYEYTSHQASGAHLGYYPSAYLPTMFGEHS